MPFVRSPVGLELHLRKLKMDVHSVAIGLGLTPPLPQATLSLALTLTGAVPRVSILIKLAGGLLLSQYWVSCCETLFDKLIDRGIITKRLMITA